MKEMLKFLKVDLGLRDMRRKVIFLQKIKKGEKDIYRIYQLKRGIIVDDQVLFVSFEEINED